MKKKPASSAPKPKSKKKEQRGSSKVAARNRRARMEAVIGETQVKHYLKVITDVLEESHELKKLVKDASLRSDTIKSMLKSFEFLNNNELDKKEFKKALTSVINEVLVAQQSELATVVVKAEMQNKLSKTILDTKFKLLAKVFPDLKAIEISDPEGANPFDKSMAALIEATKK